MLFGVLSAIALGIGVTATAQDLIAHDLLEESAVVGQNEPVVRIQEARQEANLDIADWDY